MNEKENKEKELSNSLSQSETRIQQLESLIRSLRGKEISLEFKVSDLQKKIDELENVNARLRSSYGIGEKEFELYDIPWYEWEKENGR